MKIPVDRTDLQTVINVIEKAKAISERVDEIDFLRQHPTDAAYQPTPAVLSSNPLGFTPSPFTEQLRNAKELIYYAIAREGKKSAAQGAGFPMPAAPDPRNLVTVTCGCVVSREVPQRLWAMCDTHLQLPCGCRLAKTSPPGALVKVCPMHLVEVKIPKEHIGIPAEDSA